MAFPDIRWLPPAASPVGAGALVRAALPGGEGESGLRRRLQARYGADAVLLCDSGTAALGLALRAAAAETGSGVVALPAFGCYDLATAAVGADAEVALYDVEPETLAPDQDSLEAAIGAGAGTLVVGVPFGLLAPWDEITALAERHGVLIIEDAAQSHGARWRGRLAGSFGALSILSFGRGKGWTGGGGGALLARGSIAERLPSVESELRGAGGIDAARGLALSAALWALGRPWLYGIPASLPGLGLGATLYREPWPARRLPRPAAELVLRGETRSDREAAVRSRNGDAYRTALGSVADVRAPRVPAGAMPGYLRFPVRLGRRLWERVDDRSARRLGIARTYPAPLARLPALRPRLVTNGESPGAESLVAELATLPTHSAVRATDRQRILALLKSP